MTVGPAVASAIEKARSAAEPGEARAAALKDEGNVFFKGAAHARVDRVTQLTPRAPQRGNGRARLTCTRQALNSTKPLCFMVCPAAAVWR